MTPALTWLALAARDLAGLVVPVACPGCGADDVRWCDECEAVWWSDPLRCDSGAPRLNGPGIAALPVWSVAELAGPAHAMVAAWKDGNRRDLDALLAAAMRRAAAAVAPSLPHAVTVVPVPSRAASVRRRGADLPGVLAEAVAAGLRDAGTAAGVTSCLAVGRSSQRGATARARWSQASAAVTARRAAVAEPVVLVDDVVTTGATLAAATRALEVNRITAAAGICAASAPASGARRAVRIG